MAAGPANDDLENNDPHVQAFTTCNMYGWGRGRIHPVPLTRKKQQKKQVRQRFCKYPSKNTITSKPGRVDALPLFN